jgi:hypothetical protein
MESLTFFNRDIGKDAAESKLGALGIDLVM